MTTIQNQNTKKRIRRGDLYFVDLSPAVGSEQGGIRPVLILSNDVGNAHSPTVIVAAVTAKLFKTQIPTHVQVSHTEQLKKDSIVLLEQMRTLDCSRLRDYIGRLTQNDMQAIDNALAISVGLL